MLYFDELDNVAKKAIPRSQEKIGIIKKLEFWHLSQKLVPQQDPSCQKCSR